MHARRIQGCYEDARSTRRRGSAPGTRTPAPLQCALDGYSLTLWHLSHSCTRTQAQSSGRRVCESSSYTRYCTATRSGDLSYMPRCWRCSCPAQKPGRCSPPPECTIEASAETPSARTHSRFATLSHCNDSLTAACGLPTHRLVVSGTLPRPRNSRRRQLQ